VSWEIWSDAEVVGRDGPDPCVWICGIDVRADMDDACRRINAAVAARERKAAAKALRDAAEAQVEEDPIDGHCVAAWLRARADQVEKGEA